MQKYSPYITAILAAILGILGMRFGFPPPAIIAPPTPPSEHVQPESEAPSKDLAACIVRVAMANGYCSATIIGPRHPDGTYRLLSAAHCAAKVGERVRLILRDGRSFQGEYIAIDRVSDCSIIRSDRVEGYLPFAELADSDPSPGGKVWHSGYGVDNPGNRENGTLTGTTNGAGQLSFRLSVSPGDSGGGIIADETGKVLSPVCCTTRLAEVGTVYGAAPSRCRKLLASEANLDGLAPIQMPIVND